MRPVEEGATAAHQARPVPGIDPRIRARRIEVQRTAGRRRLRRLVDVGLVLAVAAGFFAALRSPLLDVEEVRVQGTDRTAPEAVGEAAALSPGDQLIDVDTGAVGSRVAELPWVDVVTVRRRLGGAVEISVTERAPVALVGTGDAALVVDVTGRVLARAADVPEVAGTLSVRIKGLRAGVAPGGWLPGSSEEALALAGRLAAAVPGAIAVVAVGEDLRATLVQGGEVRFGDVERLSAKLRSLATVLGQVDLGCLEALDLRAPASPVLTRRAGCS